MNSSISFAANPDTEAALLAKYDAALTAFSNYDTSLIPLSDLAPLAVALTRRMQPATAEERTMFIALIGSAWPLAHQRLDPDTLELFIRQLEEELIGFPADILTAVLRDLRRSLKFPPSISEIHKLAAQLMNVRASALRTVRRHEREHECRAETVRKSAENAAVYREEQLERLHRLCTLHGVPTTALTVDDLDVAIAGMLRLPIMPFYAPWLAAFGNCERWALDVLPAAVVMGAAHEPHRRAPICPVAICRSLSRVRGAPYYMRQAVEELYAVASNDQCDTIISPDQLFADIVAEIRRACERQTASGIRSPAHHHFTLGNDRPA